MAQQVGLPLSRVQREWTSLDFAYWCVYEGISPGEPIRGDLHAALIASTVRNTLAGGNKQPLSDFMLDFSKVSKPPSGKILKEKIRSVLARAQRK